MGREWWRERAKESEGERSKKRITLDHTPQFISSYKKPKVLSVNLGYQCAPLVYNALHKTCRVALNAKMSNKRRNFAIFCFQFEMFLKVFFPAIMLKNPNVLSFTDLINCAN